MICGRLQHTPLLDDLPLAVSLLQVCLRLVKDVDLPNADLACP